ncbi:DUF4345 family protein [Nonomuraea wenchangensis]|uniref:DUF4345 family protein n=1 Tax=Nonomuraea wenchangensis TaxID=568860 RepID=UPI0037B55FA6
MDQVVIAVVAVFFAGMGIYALAAPASLIATFGITLPTANGRNEVRAVYGGFGLAVAAALALAGYDVGLRDGIVLTVALALAGMAAGRVVSMAVERPSRFYPTVFYLLVEAVLAAALLAVR